MRNESMVSSRNNTLLATNTVLRRTYLLLSLTLFFSAVCAWVSTLSGTMQGPGLLLSLMGSYGLLFLTQYLRNSVWGVVSCFAFTGFMGYTLGPLLNLYIHGFSNGGQLIMTAVGATGMVFLALSAYALVSQKDFSYLAGFLLAGMMALLVMMLGSLFLQSSVLQLVMSAGFVLLSSGLILMKTSEIIHGGERNFIMATISLYVSIYNLFVSLLQLLGAMSGNGRD